MKILTSRRINAFGGLNFVHDHLKNLSLADKLKYHLPLLPAQSTFLWHDVFSTFLSIYFCGGDCIEDAKTILKDHFGENPYFKPCSPDTILRRLKMLSAPSYYCKTPRGEVEHTYNHNSLLYALNIEVLKLCEAFKGEHVVLDYDNTIVFTEKQDSRMTYKRDYGYQPGVCLLNEDSVLFVENRNGNSDAKSFQDKTLQRMFDGLSEQNITNKFKFRADAASYQYAVIQTLEQNACSFYIGARNSYVEHLFKGINNWKKVEEKGEQKWIGECMYTPFIKHYKKGQLPKQYRLLVKRKLNKTGQTNILTGDAYEYRAIITNDSETENQEAVAFYNQRGAAEKQFDILKNDFGWAKLPFSKLEQNCVFMYFAGICRNLYKRIIQTIAKRFKNIRPTDRMKRFVFAFITKPAVWVKKSRQWHLRIYGELHLRV